MKTLTLLTAALLAGGLITHAQDWSQWGGSQYRNMYSPAKGLPDRFEPGKLVKGTENYDPATQKNVKFTVKLGSQSYGNPTIANGRIYVGTNNDVPRDKRHLGDRSILLCLDEKTGNLNWQLVVSKLKSGKVNDWESLGLFSSAVIEGNRLYVVTTRCEILCLDVEGLANGNDGPYKDEAKYVVQDVLGADASRPRPSRQATRTPTSSGVTT